jgi:RNA polymerase sigma factor (sigma-70 family)
VGVDAEEERGFREFVTARGPALMRLGYLLTGGDQHAAEDLVQSALSKALRHWARVETPEAYVRQAMYRQQVSRWRQGRDRVERTTGSVPDRAVPDRAGQVDLRLALRAALATLTPRQRAVLVLREVLDFRASEVAAMLDVTEVSVNRALHRARRRIEQTATPDGRKLVPLPASPDERALVTRFVTAFEAGDVATVIELLSDDATLTMPPTPLVYQGREAIGRFLSTVPAAGRLDQFKLVATRANGQPAFGCYLRDPHTPIAHAYGLMVLTLSGDRLTAITGFPDTGVFRAFGLPRTIQT